jgi:two-component system, OmpR family, phosphate regulon response regulator PhoB
MTKPFVLIVEDDPKLNEIINLTLQGDFELETCADGNTAMELLANIIPQIVVLDLHIPGTPGQEILTHLRSDKRFWRTRVILTTADNRLAETLHNDVDIVLLKPVSPNQLRELALRISSLQ